MLNKITNKKKNFNEKKNFLKIKKHGYANLMLIKKLNNIIFHFKFNFFHFSRLYAHIYIHRFLDKCDHSYCRYVRVCILSHVIIFFINAC